MASTISAGTTAGTAIAIAGDTTGNLAFQTNGTTTAMTIDTSQNVGVKTTPSSWGTGFTAIDYGVNSAIYDISGYTGIAENCYYNSGWKYKTTGTANKFEQTGGVQYFQYAASGSAGAAISFTESMRIDSSGNLGVGTTPYASARFSVATNSSANGYQVANIYNSAASGTAKQANTLIRIASQGSGADCSIVMTDSVTYNIFYGANNGQAYVIANSGGVYLGSGAGSWASISDQRLKDVTGTYTNALADVAQLEPIKFTWKSDADKKPQVGLIAQSVEKVIPEAVENTTVGDDTTEYLGVRYTEVIPLLVAAIQELNAKVDAQAAEIAALKGAQ